MWVGSSQRVTPEMGSEQGAGITQGKDRGNSITAERGLQHGPGHGSEEWGESFSMFSVAGGIVDVERKEVGEQERAQQSQKGIFFSYRRQ